MSTFRVVAGDTFELIARQRYGTELEAKRIADANPGVFEPLVPGSIIIVPTDPLAPQDQPSVTPADNPDEVALLINNKRYRFWTNVLITRAIDVADTIEFAAPFDADAPGFRETFRPFTFKPLAVTVGGQPLFTGTMVAIDPTLGDSKTLAVSGYSLPGVLNDCNAPASSFPLEFDGQSLKEISKTVASPFGIGVEFRADPGAKFDRVASTPTKKVLAFLAELARQRNLVIGSTTRGKLLYWQSIRPGNPVARLRQGVSPVLGVVPSFNPQEYYSHITGIEPPLAGFETRQYTVKNPHLEGVTRPLTFKAPDTFDGEIKVATEAKMGRMFGNIASWSVPVATWRDPQGNLWEPNTTVTLLAPDAMVYTEYEFIIRSVQFEADKSRRSATLKLVMPGSFDGRIPESLPWD